MVGAVKAFYDHHAQVAYNANCEVPWVSRSNGENSALLSVKTLFYCFTHWKIMELGVMSTENQSPITTIVFHFKT